ncbi:MAG: SEC-C metal-binding domain-containing protein [Candidatus Thermoplasmatota archaeon]|nr:SEC-C metal-binding domain-containing protein [Candidatus Thermoplasmatota archaeon]
MGKIGRNDPCPCGSNKKYKKCCLPLESTIGSLEDVSGQIKFAADWIYSNEWLKEEFEILKQTYSSALDTTLLKKLEPFFQDIFLFDHELKEACSISPFHYFLQHADISPRYKDLYQGFLNNKLHFYEVLDIDRSNHHMELKDTVTNDSFRVNIHGEADCTCEDIILARIAFYKGTSILLTSLSDPFYVMIAPQLYPTLYEYPADRRRGRVSGFDILDLFCKKIGPSETLEETKKQLKKKSKDIGLYIDLRGLSARINSNQTLEEAFPEFIDFDYLTNRDHDETIALLKRIWATHPRKDLKGKTISETYPIGVMEEAFINEFSIIVEQKIDPNTFPTLDEANSAMCRFREQWLDDSVDLFNGRTPRQMILDERKQLNNPSKDIDLDCYIEPKKDYDLNLADKINKEGLKYFNRGQLMAAADCFDQLTKMYPGFYHAWGNLGSSYVYMGEKEYAEYCLMKALSIQPDYEFAKDRLAFIKDKTNKQLSMYGIIGATIGVMHQGFGKNEKEFDESFNVWEELKKEKAKVGKEKNK